jgi:hypothetical protein
MLVCPKLHTLQGFSVCLGFLEWRVRMVPEGGCSVAGRAFADRQIVGVRADRLLVKNNAECCTNPLR